MAWAMDIEITGRNPDVDDWYVIGAKIYPLWVTWYSVWGKQED
tara:strand:- start:148 stop:276 length:129 start_codon:yes stop_codon:yes gene_type:complete